MDEPRGLKAAADELYSLEPSQFVARRDELVKQARAAKDRALANAIKALRRPTLGAWYANVASRARLTSLVEWQRLGRELRAAQASGDFKQVVALGPQRASLERRVLRDLTAHLAALEISASPAALEEVRSTLRASLSDEDAATALDRAQLSQPLTYGGLSEGLTASLTALSPPAHETAPKPTESSVSQSEYPGDSNPHTPDTDAAAPRAAGDEKAPAAATPAPDDYAAMLAAMIGGSGVAAPTSAVETSPHRGAVPETEPEPTPESAVDHEPADEPGPADDAQPDPSEAEPNRSDDASDADDDELAALEREAAEAEEALRESQAKLEALRSKQAQLKAQRALGAAQEQLDEARQRADVARAERDRLASALAQAEQTLRGAEDDLAAASTAVERLTAEAGRP